MTSIPSTTDISYSAFLVGGGSTSHYMQSIAAAGLYGQNANTVAAAATAATGTKFNATSELITPNYSSSAIPHSSRNNSESAMRSPFNEQQFLSSYPSTEALSRQVSAMQSAQLTPLMQHATKSNKYAAITSVMTPSTVAEDKSILSPVQSYPQCIDYSPHEPVSAASTTPLHVQQQQQHAPKTVGHTKQHSSIGFAPSQSNWSSGQNSCHEISQFNFSIIAQNSTPMLFGSSSIGSAIQNICLETDEETPGAVAAVHTNIFEPNQSMCSNINFHNTSQTNCPQHPMKKVKYQMSHDEAVKFCSSCAVDFAQKGFSIQEIVKQQCKNSSQLEREMEEFLVELTRVKTDNSTLLNNLDATIANVKTKCQKETQTVHDLFLSVEKALYDEKTRALSAINEHMWSCINLLEQRKNEVRMQDKHCTRNEQDILRNTDKIISEMEVHEVREILNSYREELSVTKARIDSIYAETSMRLLSYNPAQVQQELAVLKKSLINDLFKPAVSKIDVIQSANSSSKNVQSTLRTQESPQLSRLMANPEEKKYLQQQLQLKQQQQQQQQQHHQHQQFSAQLTPMDLNYQTNLAQYQINQQQYASTTQQRQPSSSQQYLQSPMAGQHIRPTMVVPQQEIIEMSMSEKVHTQESDEISSVQGMLPLVMMDSNGSSSGNNINSNNMNNHVANNILTNNSSSNNYTQNNHNSNPNTNNVSKISNKANVSQHKIINYSDIHDETAVPARLLNDHLKKPSNQYRQNISRPGDARNLSNGMVSVLSEKKNVQQQQCMSPPIGLAVGRTSSMSKEISAAVTTNPVLGGGNSKMKQYQFTAQTEPTHLQNNKFKVMPSKPGNYQRNLMMNDELLPSNKFKLPGSQIASAATTTAASATINIAGVTSSSNLITKGLSGVSNTAVAAAGGGSAAQSSSLQSQLKIGWQKSGLEVEKNVRMPVGHSHSSSSSSASQLLGKQMFPYNFAGSNKMTGK